MVLEQSSAVVTASDELVKVQLIDIDEFKNMITYQKSTQSFSGYGMAVAQAKFVVNEIINILKTKEIEVIFVIHPVAGRMPGHMNVLLAEAQIPYDIVYEMEEVNDDFDNIDLSIVISANDIVNPSALEDPNSPIAGIPGYRMLERDTHGCDEKRNVYWLCWSRKSTFL